MIDELQHVEACCSMHLMLDLEPEEVKTEGPAEACSRAEEEEGAQAWYMAVALEGKAMAHL